MSESMVVVTGEGLGRGDDELGRRLMIKFFGQLATLGDKPHVVAFYNAGVKLLVHGSPVLDALHALERDGVELIACGTWWSISCSMDTSPSAAFPICAKSSGPCRHPRR